MDNNYTWLLFDADGTLFDFEQSEAVSLQQSIEQLGYPYEQDYLTTYREVNRKIWNDFEQGKLAQAELKVKRFELFLERVKVDIQPETFSQHYLGNLANGTYLLEGSEEIIKALSTSYRLLIMTNGLKEVQRSRLEKSTLHNYIDELIVSDEIGVAKPQAGIFDVAFAAMGHPQKAETLIIGDSLSSDIAGGINYGIDTCWYNPDKKRRPDGLTITYEINGLTELMELLAK
ncbi:YjjG family noncanonical pyrimidine nucleotidase [Chloroflexi bacterium TSY]|nr:YjjG family noncanonical pyrimidine nucleotidase [Chloroflexi bacterium TSY]